MKKHAYLLIFLFLGIAMNGQELIRSTVGVSGSSSDVKSGDKTLLVQQSVGQSSVIGLYSSSAITIRQGFIQPPIKILSTGSNNTNPIDAVVYPNPFESRITVVFNETLNEPLNITIYDVQGRVVFERMTKAEQEIQIDLGFLSTAQYILLLTSENREFKANILKN